MDTEIYKVKINLQSMVDRLRVKDLFSLRHRYPAFQFLHRRKVWEPMENQMGPPSAMFAIIARSTYNMHGHPMFTIVAGSRCTT